MDIYIHDKTIWNTAKAGLTCRRVAPSEGREGNGRGKESVN